MDNKGCVNQTIVLKLKEVRYTLRIGRVSSLRLVRSGELPAFRVGRDWRVLKSELERFMRTGRKSEAEAHEQKDL